MFQTADELDGFMEHAVASGFSRKVMIGVLTTSCFGWQNTALGLCISSLRMPSRPKSSKKAVQPMLPWRGARRI